jgi:hypothetical protein
MPNPFSSGGVSSRRQTASRLADFVHLYQSVDIRRRWHTLEAD